MTLLPARFHLRPRMRTTPAERTIARGARRRCWPMGAASMVVPRSSHTATLLPDGEVLMAGGCTSAYGFQPSASAETYNPNVLAPGPVVYSVPDGTLKQGA